jgi:hypothetical protein
MASLILGDIHSRFFVIYANDDLVPILFPLGSDGLVVVTSLRLSLRFWLSEDFMFIDDEIYDVLSRDLVQTIKQSPVCNGDSKQWLFRPGRYQVYSVSD